MATRKAKSSRDSAVEGEKPSAGSLFLVWGGDEYLVSARAKQLVHKLCPPQEQALGLEIIEGAVETVDEAAAALTTCVDAVTTVGFFGSTKVVWLRDASFFSESPPGKSEAVKEHVGRLTEEIKRGLLEGQKLVISTPKVDRRSAFFKACQAAGTVMEFSLPEKAYQVEEQARETAGHLVAEAGLAASGEALELLLAKAGTDTRQLAQEVQKLAAYMGDRKKVEADDVHEIVSASRTAAGWDLADAVGKRDLAGALRTLRQLLFQKESAVGLIIGLQNRARELLVFKLCLDRRWLRPSRFSVDWSAPDGALERLPLNPRAMNPYRAARLAEQAARFSEDDLLRFHRLLVETHERMVSSAIPAELLLEFCLIHMLAGGHRATA